MKFERPILEFKEKLERNNELLLNYKRIIEDLKKDFSKYEIRQVISTKFGKVTANITIERVEAKRRRINSKNKSYKPVQY